MCTCVVLNLAAKQGQCWNDWLLAKLKMNWQWSEHWAVLCRLCSLQTLITSQNILTVKVGNRWLGMPCTLPIVACALRFPVVIYCLFPVPHRVSWSCSDVVLRAVVVVLIDWVACSGPECARWRLRWKVSIVVVSETTRVIVVWISHTVARVSYMLNWCDSVLMPHTVCLLLAGFTCIRVSAQGGSNTKTGWRLRILEKSEMCVVVRCVRCSSGLCFV